MLDSRHPALIWLIWPSLSLLEKLSFLALCILGVYWLFLAATVVRFRSTAPVQENLVRIRKRVRNLQQATVAAFCLFGFVLSAGLHSGPFRLRWQRILRSSDFSLRPVVCREQSGCSRFALKSVAAPLSKRACEVGVTSLDTPSPCRVSVGLGQLPSRNE
jgi:hypothetical protein